MGTVMGGACSTHAKMNNSYNILAEKLVRRRPKFEG